MLNIEIGSKADTNNSGKNVHPYMRNNFKGTEEIQAIMERISKRHNVTSY